MGDPIEDVLKELADTANYLRETGKIARAGVERLLAVEEDLMKLNRYLGLITEQADQAIHAAVRAREDRDE